MKKHIRIEHLLPKVLCASMTKLYVDGERVRCHEIEPLCKDNFLHMTVQKEETDLGTLMFIEFDGFVKLEEYDNGGETQIRALISIEEEI